MIFMEKMQLDCYTVPELPPSRNTLHNCIDIKSSMITQIDALNIATATGIF